MRFFLFAAALLALSGCGTLKPPVTEYRITIQDAGAKSGVGGCKDKSLKIAQSFSMSSLLSLQMDYTESDNKIFSYSQSQWQESPNSFITSELFKSIRDFELFGSVHSSKSRIKTDFVLETNIEEFMQFYNEDLSASNVYVVISLALIDAKTQSVLATKTLRSKVDAKTLDAAGGVDALGKALSEVVSKNREWLEGVCR